MKTTPNQIEQERKALRRKMAGVKSYLSRLHNRYSNDLKSGDPERRAIGHLNHLTSRINAKQEEFRTLGKRLREIEGRDTL